MAKTLKELYDNNELPKGLYYIKRDDPRGYAPFYKLVRYDNRFFFDVYNKRLLLEENDIIACRVPSGEDTLHLEKCHDALIELYKKVKVDITLNGKSLKSISFVEMVEGILNDDCRF